MFAAILASLAFTLTYATVAAKSRRAALVLIPILNILQSVPVLGLSFAVAFRVVSGRVLGAEFAAIFAIFTSQAWNMTFSPAVQPEKSSPSQADRNRRQTSEPGLLRAATACARSRRGRR